MFRAVGLHFVSELHARVSAAAHLADQSVTAGIDCCRVDGRSTTAAASEILRIVTAWKLDQSSRSLAAGGGGGGGKQANRAQGND